MSEIPRVGLPNLLSQSELLARSRGAYTGAEANVRDAVRQELQADAVQRAERLPAAARVEAVGKRREERRDPREDGEEDDGHSHWDEAPDDDERPGLDLTA
jgi:hypothetical protein